MSSLEKNDMAPPCEFQENLEILRQTYFFSGLPLETLKIFAYLCTREAYKQGEHIFNQGEEDGQAFYIIGGRARLEHADNGTTMSIRDFGTGDFIGGLTLLGETRRLFSLTSVTDTTCLVLTRGKFLKTMEQFPNLLARICNSVAQSVDIWEDRFLSDCRDQCGDCVGRLGVTLI